MSIAEWTRILARLASLEPPGAASLNAFRKQYERVDLYEREYVTAADGHRVPLGEYLARHFGTPPPEAANAPVPRERPRPPDLPPTLDPDATLTVSYVADASSRPLLTPAGNLATLPDPRNRDATWLLTAEAGCVRARRGVTGEIAVLLPLRQTITTATTVGPVTYLSGPDGVSAVDLATRGVFWEFRLPEADPLPPAGMTAWLPPRGAVMPHPGFGPFHITPTHLVALWGNTHLVGVNRGTGGLDWVRPAGDSPILAVPPGDSPRFSPALWTGAGVILCQLTTGVRWTVRSSSGEVVGREPSAPIAWVSPPVQLADGRLAVPGDLGRVELDTTPGDGSRFGVRGRWPWEPGAVASLTGTPTQLLPAGQGLLAAVARNYGTEVQLLTPDGRALRPRGVVLPAFGVDLARARRAEHATFVPAGGKLYALRDFDGRLAWPATDLAALTNWPRDAAWRVLPGRRAVLAYPEMARPLVPFGTTARRLLHQAARHPHATLLPSFLFAFADDVARLPAAAVVPRPRDRPGAFDPRTRRHWPGRRRRYGGGKPRRRRGRSHLPPKIALTAHSECPRRADPRIC